MSFQAKTAITMMEGVFEFVEDYFVLYFCASFISEVQCLAFWLHQAPMREFFWAKVEYFYFLTPTTIE